MITQRDIKLYLYGNNSYVIGDNISNKKYIISSNHITVGYFIPDDYIEYTNDKVKIFLDSKFILLTTDNLLILTFHKVVVDLKEKIIHQLTRDEYRILIRDSKISDKKFIILSNK
jgi:hypothetical protein